MEEFDIIIIGAGSAGSVLASQLALNTQYSILLLEAGGKNTSKWINIPIGYGKSFTNPKVNWMEYSSPDGSLTGDSLYMPRGKGLGGSSAINAMVYTRGFKKDYDDWQSKDWTGDIFWQAFDEIENRVGEPEITPNENPITVSRRVESFHPITQKFAQACEELKLPPTDMVAPEQGYGDYRFTIKNGRRDFGKTAFLDQAKSRKNLHIKTHAQVERIGFEGKRAQTVFYRRKGKGRLQKVKARAQILLCAGAFRTPHILMQSGIGDQTQLESSGIKCLHHNPNIGKNLQDHIAVSYHYRANEPTLNAVFGRLSGRLGAGMSYLFKRSGPMSLSVNQMGAFLRSSPTRTQPDFQLYFNPISFDRNDPELRDAKYPPKENGLILSFNSCRPTSQGQIELNQAAPAAAPIIKPNYLNTEKDQNDVLMGAAIIKAFEATNSMRSLIEFPTGLPLWDASAAEIMDDFKARAGTVFHPCGTAKIGSPHRDGVVDESLDVHGVQGLKIVDASVFPNITSGNTNAPVTALAWIAAKRVIEELRS